MFLSLVTLTVTNTHPRVEPQKEKVFKIIVSNEQFSQKEL